jgi:4-amino-4-deoxy-L-arabinose transferase-like glycosyltransferase
MFDIQEKEIKKKLFILIAAATAIRLFIAATLEFSVDEVYYWTYALYPDWSHFDHPPMVGWVIQLFSLNLFFESELAVRLGAIVFSIFNTLIIYEIGKMVKNPLAGLYAAFLLNASVYCSVLAGSFILPDSPQLLFWLLSLRYLIMALPSRNITSKISRKFLLASLFVGLAIIAKYHGVFIWAGIGL